MKQGELFEGLKSRGGDGKGDGLADKYLGDERFELRLTIDKVIFVLLAVFILLVVVFTLGVEHGKKRELKYLSKKHEVESITNLAKVREAQRSLGIKKKTGSPAGAETGKTKNSWMKLSFPGEKEFRKTPKKAPEKEEPPEVTIKKKASEEKKPVSEEAPVPKPAGPAPGTKSYEVRIMSVKKKEFADNEVTRLKKKDFLVTSRKSGKYYMVVLGPYPERSKADNALVRVRKFSPYKDAYIRRLVA
jgi:hypothetical protein